MKLAKGWDGDGWSISENFYWPTGGPRYNKDLIVSAGGQYVEQVGVVKRQVVRHSCVHPCWPFLQGEEDFLLCEQSDEIIDG